MGSPTGSGNQGLRILSVCGWPCSAWRHTHGCVYFLQQHHDLLGLKHYVTTILGDVESPERWKKIGGPPNISQGPTGPTGCGPFQQGAREVGRWRLGEGPWQLGRVTEDTWVNGKTSRLKAERFDAGISAKDRVDYIHILIECHISSHSPRKKRQQPFVWLHRWHPKCGTPCRPFPAAWYLLV